MKKFQCLLFIDDDFPTNYYHQEISEESGVAVQLLFYQKPLEAIRYLYELKTENNTMPEIIFLDINMPGMDGWEFVELYGKRIAPSPSKIIMLSTSYNPEDQFKAEQNKWIDAFKSKPLTIEFLRDLRNEMVDG